MEFDDRQREEIPKRTELENLLEELDKSTITYENYKRYYDKIANASQGVIIQIQNLTREYKEVSRRYNELIKKDRGMDEGIVSKEIFELNVSMRRIIQEAFNWRTLQAEMLNIIFQKTGNMFDDIRALDIKRDALKEIKEMEEKRQQLFFDIMTSQSAMFKEAVLQKFNMVDEKFFSFINMIEEKSRNEKRDLFNMFNNIIKLIVTDEKEKQYELYNKTKELVEKEVFVKEDKEKITQPLTKIKPKEKEEKEHEDGFDTPTPQPKKVGRPPIDRKKNDDIKKSFERVDLTDTEVDLDDY